MTATRHHLPAMLTAAETRLVMTGQNARRCGAGDTTPTHRLTPTGRAS